MSRTKSDESITALAIAGTLLTVGGFVIAAAFSGRLSVRAAKQNTDGPSDAPQRTEPGVTPLPPRLRGYGEDDLEAAARMLASEKGSGSRELWTEMIWSQIHARKPGETLYERITAGSGYGPQGKATWPGKKRPVATDQSAFPVHLSFAEEVLGGLHPARFAGATAFFEPEEQDKALRVATRARQKAKQGLPLTAQESRLRHYQQSAEEIRADWQKTMRMVGTIDGMEFYEEMSRLNPGKSDFAIRERAKVLSWPITPTELQRVGDGVTDSRPSTGQPHKGVDLFAEPGTEVHAARSGQVKRVVDGRGSKREHTRRAGLWVDVEVGDQIDRYMHLGEARVTEGQKVRRGDVLGVIAEAHTSGTGDGPHLHFEVRAADYNKERGDYGAPVTPKFEVV